MVERPEQATLCEESICKCCLKGRSVHRIDLLPFPPSAKGILTRNVFGHESFIHEIPVLMHTSPLLHSSAS